MFQWIVGKNSTMLVIQCVLKVLVGPGEQVAGTHARGPGCENYLTVY